MKKIRNWFLENAYERGWYVDYDEDTHKPATIRWCDGTYADMKLWEIVVAKIAFGNAARDFKGDIFEAFEYIVEGAKQLLSGTLGFALMVFYPLMLALRAYGSRKSALRDCARMWDAPTEKARIARAQEWNDKQKAFWERPEENVEKDW